MIGTVQGDVHEIGKQIVSAMLSGAGFRVHDLGTDVTGEQLVEKVRQLQPDIVARFSLYHHNQHASARDRHRALDEAGLRDESEISYRRRFSE